MIASLHHFYSPNQNLNDISSLVIMSLYANEASLKRILKNIHNMQQKMYIVKTLRNNYSVIIRMKVIIKFTKTLFHRENNTQNWRIIIPIEIKTTIIEINHDKLGHPGVYKMLQHLKKFYFWKCMHKDVKSFILRCDLGQRTKYLTIAMEGTFQPVHVQNPCELVTVDCYGPLPRGRGGVEYLFVILDEFSKLVKLYPVIKATSDISLKKILNEHIPECGKPVRVLSDNGTQFTSSKWKLFRK